MRGFRLIGGGLFAALAVACVTAIGRCDDAPAPTNAYIGLRTAPLNADDRARHEELPASAGVGITYVVPDSPATRAGLEADDVLVAVDGRFVRENDGIDAIVERLEPGARVEVQFSRAGRRRRTFVEVERRREAAAFAVDDRAELARAAILRQQRPKSRRDDLGLAMGPVRERAVALSKNDAQPVKVVVEESGRTWAWNADADVPAGVPRGAVDDVERLLVGFDKQRTRNGLRFRIQPRADGEARSVVVLICQPAPDDGYRLLEVERATTADGTVPVDDLLAEERVRGELARLSDPIRTKLIKALRAHRPPPVQVQVRQPK